MDVSFSRDGAGFDLADRAEGVTVRLSGVWTVAHLADLDAPLRALAFPSHIPVMIDLSAVEALDTAGAWLVDRTAAQIAEARGEPEDAARAHITGATENQLLLIERVRSRYAPCEIAPPAVNPVIAKLTALGEAVSLAGREVVEMLAFSGLIFETFFRSLLNPRRIRWTSFVHHMEEAGLNALPIIALMTFLIGAVLAFLGADILEQFGAQFYTINLISYGVLREFGVLLTAIMIAGRSGSAFTAQIGTMKAREEIDAMRTLGLDPIELLVLPRVMALVVAAPLLTILANFMGLLGGGVIAWAVLDIQPGLFLSRLAEVTELNYLIVGLIKAPVFAFFIAMIGCYQGTMVTGSAESVGNRTTISVVEAIFVVIVFDALFATIFVEIGL